MCERGCAVLAPLGCDLGGQPPSRLVLWVSPCTTQATLEDASNRSRGGAEGRGCRHRGHKHYMRLLGPLLGTHSAGGKVVVAADILVALWAGCRWHCFEGYSGCTGQ